nr:syntaxin-binding protein 5-like [Tanacetum cinerariifolium]
MITSNNKPIHVETETDSFGFLVDKSSSFVVSGHTSVSLPSYVLDAYEEYLSSNAGKDFMNHIDFKYVRCAVIASLGFTKKQKGETLGIYLRTNHASFSCTRLRDTKSKGLPYTKRFRFLIAVHYGIPSTTSVLAFDPIQLVLSIGTLDGRIKVIGGDNIEGLLIPPKKFPFKYLEPYFFHVLIRQLPMFYTFCSLVITYVPEGRYSVPAMIAHPPTHQPHPCTIYALESMVLYVIEPWQKWMLPNTTKVAGMKIVYDGITYSVLRAGHESPDDFAISLMNILSHHEAKYLTSLQALTATDAGTSSVLSFDGGTSPFFLPLAVILDASHGAGYVDPETFEEFKVVENGQVEYYKIKMRTQAETVGLQQKMENAKKQRCN